MTYPYFRSSSTTHCTMPRHRWLNIHKHWYDLTGYQGRTLPTELLFTVAKMHLYDAIESDVFRTIDNKVCWLSRFGPSALTLPFREKVQILAPSWHSFIRGTKPRSTDFGLRQTRANPKSCILYISIFSILAGVGKACETLYLGTIISKISFV